MKAGWTLTIVVAMSAVMTGCGGGWWPFARSDGEQPRRLPEGAVEHACAQGKRLLLRHAPDGKSVWVIYPDREFRLDRLAAGPGERYSNGVSTLIAEVDGISLDSNGIREFAECKRK